MMGSPFGPGRLECLLMAWTMMAIARIRINAANAIVGFKTKLNIIDIFFVLFFFAFFEKNYIQDVPMISLSLQKCAT